LEKDLRSHGGKRELKLRKWLVYLTLFVSAITIIIDLITFIYNFLGGDLTVQFFLKICVVLLVAVAVFGYYAWELRRKDFKSKTPRTLAWIVSVFVLASIVVGFFIVGTPSVQRSRQYDTRRVEDLQYIQNQIINYWVNKQELPQNLSDLEDSISGFTVPDDPESGASYEYIISDPLNFKLCADFKTSSEDMGIVPSAVKPAYPYDMSQQNWNHSSGNVCFSRTIDPDLYQKTSAPATSPTR